MILTHYKSSINKLRESSIIDAYDSTKLKMYLVLSTTRMETIRVIEELLKFKHLMGL